MIFSCPDLGDYPTILWTDTVRLCQISYISYHQSLNHKRPKRALDCNNYCMFDYIEKYITKIYFKMKFTCLFDCVYCFCCYFAVITFFKRFTVDGCDKSLVYI